MYYYQAKPIGKNLKEKKSTSDGFGEKGNKMKNEKIYLYLDDTRTPKEGNWEVVRGYDELVAHIRLNGLENYEVISLDHDLGESAMEEYYNNARPNFEIDYKNIVEKTGMDCVRWLVAESMTSGIPLPQIYVHSANPIGSANIIGYVNNYLKNQKLPTACVSVTIPHTITIKQFYD